MQVKNDVNCGFKLEQVKCCQINCYEKYYIYIYMNVQIVYKTLWTFRPPNNKLPIQV